MSNSTYQELTVQIKIKFGALAKVMSWCRENCKHDWYLKDNTMEWEQPPTIAPIEDFYVFKFTDEKDLLLFTLKWK